MTEAIIYHNPRCSKSRETLALLEQLHDNITVVKYLETPPNTETIAHLVELLGVNIRDILRKNEDEYQKNGFSQTDLTDEELIALVHQFPKVLERPIVEYNNKAIVGRPPENVLSLFK
ncbi:MAG: arsenate reductase (glutaredoxin) [Marinicella sp.]|nr:arsenate reductase (glutaredoxin) [Xanthomonadales bacterium]